MTRRIKALLRGAAKVLLRRYLGVVLRLFSGIVAFSHVASEMTSEIAHTLGSSG